MGFWEEFLLDLYNAKFFFSEIALENGRDNSNKMHGITLGNFRKFVMV